VDIVTELILAKAEINVTDKVIETCPVHPFTTCTFLHSMNPRRVPIPRQILHFSSSAIPQRQVTCPSRIIQARVLQSLTSPFLVASSALSECLQFFSRF
jgi:hypothetical protein